MLHFNGLSRKRFPRMSLRKKEHSRQPRAFASATRQQVHGAGLLEIKILTYERASFMGTGQGHHRDIYGRFVTLTDKAK